jgi:hypothetical protein
VRGHGIAGPRSDFTRPVSGPAKFEPFRVPFARLNLREQRASDLARPFT